MKYKALWLIIVALGFALSVTFMSCKKDAATGPGGGSQVTQVLTNGTLTPVSRTQAQGTMFVTDQSGNAISGLTSQNVSSLLKWVIGATPDSVNGTTSVQSLTQSGKSIAVALTMDYSGSMYVGPIDSATGKERRILDMENAVKSFINALGATDVAEIIKFDHRIVLSQAFTSNKTLLLNAVNDSGYYRLGGSTALYQSINQGILDASTQSSVTYSRAVVAMTDGGENASSISRDSVFRSSRAFGIPVYTVGLLDTFSHSTPPGQFFPERDLVEIADTTGGFYFWAGDAAQLASIYGKVSGQISNAYTIVINWPSANLPPSGTQVTTVVTVTYNNLVAKFQRSYSIP